MTGFLTEFVQALAQDLDLLGLWGNKQRAGSEVKALALARADELGRKNEAL